MKVTYKTYWRKTGLKKDWGQVFLNIVSEHKPKVFLEVGVFCGEVSDKCSTPVALLLPEPNQVQRRLLSRPESLCDALEAGKTREHAKLQLLRLLGCLWRIDQSCCITFATYSDDSAKP